ncbi:hypothetical protein BBBOND_0109920 [Babesia bigemina]|uniref:Uncharacterized protein n=1 Tax=Babesia bigemina TaxID=5866 RepID=A0A061D6Y8_BABBI|nr:hypothetical protein BBBOND_0109920 [Babesia bigemina]CDR94694.1 hypothetical protein BBBOND_0109920 [Babesia bigemina]|eukprot:XP_012766880.1 hypothetical protein BBBOND_0109920 [Babesia bigemina]
MSARRINSVVTCDNSSALISDLFQHLASKCLSEVNDGFGWAISFIFETQYTGTSVFMPRLTNSPNGFVSCVLGTLCIRLGTLFLSYRDMNKTLYASYDNVPPKEWIWPYLWKESGRPDNRAAPVKARERYMHWPRKKASTRRTMERDSCSR